MQPKAELVLESNAGKIKQALHKIRPLIRDKKWKEAAEALKELDTDQQALCFWLVAHLDATIYLNKSYLQPQLERDINSILGEDKAAPNVIVAMQLLGLLKYEHKQSAAGRVEGEYVAKVEALPARFRKQFTEN